MLKRQEVDEENDLGQIISQELDLSDIVVIPTTNKRDEGQTYEEEGIYSFSSH